MAEDVRLGCEPSQRRGRNPCRAGGSAAGSAVHPNRLAIRLRFSWRRAGETQGRRPAPKTVAAGSTPCVAQGEWVLSEGTTFVGRDRDCAVRIDSPTLSRRHARIVAAGGETTLEDLGSKNGTQVSGQRIKQPIALKDSDEIQVGSLKLTYRVLDTLPSTLTRRRM